MGHGHRAEETGEKSFTTQLTYYDSYSVPIPRRLPLSLYIHVQLQAMVKKQRIVERVKRERRTFAGIKSYKKRK